MADDENATDQDPNGTDATPPTPSESEATTQQDAVADAAAPATEQLPTGPTTPMVAVSTASAAAKNKRMALIGAGVAAVLVIVVIAVVAGGGDDKSSSPATDPTSLSSEPTTDSQPTETTGTPDSGQPTTTAAAPLVIELPAPTAPIALLEHPDGIAPLLSRFSPDGSRVFGGYMHPDNSITSAVWNTQTGQIVTTLPGGKTPSAFSTSGTLLVLTTTVTDADGKSTSSSSLYDTTDGTELRALAAPGSYNAAFSPDDHVIATAGDGGAVVLLDVSTGEVLHTLSDDPSSQTTAFAFSADGAQVATATTQGSVKVWEVASGAELQHITGIPGTIDHIALSSDGTRVVTWGYGSPVSIRDVGTGAVLSPSTPVSAEAVSAVSLRGAVGLTNEEIVRVFDVSSGATIADLPHRVMGPDRRYQLNSVTLNHDGSRAFVSLSPDSGFDTAIGVTWDIASRKVVVYIENALNALLSPNGDLMITLDGSVYKIG